MNRSLGAVAVALTLLGIGRSPASAATCVFPDAATAFRDASVIVHGTVRLLNVDDLRRGGSFEIEVSRVFKGTATRIMRVNVQPDGGGAVGYPQVDVGQDHTLYLRASGAFPETSPSPSYAAGALFTSGCFGSHPGPPTAEETRTLGAGEATVEEAPPPPAVMPSAPLAALALIVAFGAGLAAFGWKRRRGRSSAS